MASSAMAAKGGLLPLPVMPYTAHGKCSNEAVQCGRARSSCKHAFCANYGTVGLAGAVRALPVSVPNWSALPDKARTYCSFRPPLRCSRLNSSGSYASSTLSSISQCGFCGSVAFHDRSSKFRVPALSLTACKPSVTVTSSADAHSRASNLSELEGANGSAKVGTEILTSGSFKGANHILEEGVAVSEDGPFSRTEMVNLLEGAGFRVEQVPSSRLELGEAANEIGEGSAVLFVRAEQTSVQELLTLLQRQGFRGQAVRGKTAAQSTAASLSNANQISATSVPQMRQDEPRSILGTGPVLPDVWESTPEGRWFLDKTKQMVDQQKMHQIKGQLIAKEELSGKDSGELKEMTAGESGIASKGLVYSASAEEPTLGPSIVAWDQGLRSFTQKWGGVVVLGIIACVIAAVVRVTSRNEKEKRRKKQEEQRRGREKLRKVELVVKQLDMEEKALLEEGKKLERRVNFRNAEEKDMYNQAWEIREMQQHARIIVAKEKKDQEMRRQKENAKMEREAAMEGHERKVLAEKRRAANDRKRREESLRLALEKEEDEEEIEGATRLENEIRELLDSERAKDEELRLLEHQATLPSGPVQTLERILTTASRESLSRGTEKQAENKEIKGDGREEGWARPSSSVDITKGQNYQEPSSSNGSAGRVDGRDSIAGGINGSANQEAKYAPARPSLQREQPASLNSAEGSSKAESRGGGGTELGSTGEGATSERVSPSSDLPSSSPQPYAAQDKGWVRPKPNPGLGQLSASRIQAKINGAAGPRAELATEDAPEPLPVVTGGDAASPLKQNEAERVPAVDGAAANGRAAPGGSTGGLDDGAAQMSQQERPRVEANLRAQSGQEALPIGMRALTTQVNGMASQIGKQSARAGPMGIPEPPILSEPGTRVQGRAPAGQRVRIIRAKEVLGTRNKGGSASQGSGPASLEQQDERVQGSGPAEGGKRVEGERDGGAQEGEGDQKSGKDSDDRLTTEEEQLLKQLSDNGLFLRVEGNALKKSPFPRVSSPALDEEDLARLFEGVDEEKALKLFEKLAKKEAKVKDYVRGAWEEKIDFEKDPIRATDPIEYYETKLRPAEDQSEASTKRTSRQGPAEEKTPSFTANTAEASSSLELEILPPSSSSRGDFRSASISSPAPSSSSATFSSRTDSNSVPRVSSPPLDPTDPTFSFASTLPPPSFKLSQYASSLPSAASSGSASPSLSSNGVPEPAEEETNVTPSQAWEPRGSGSEGATPGINGRSDGSAVPGGGDSVASSSRAVNGSIPAVGSGEGSSAEAGPGAANYLGGRSGSQLEWSREVVEGEGSRMEAEGADPGSEETAAAAQRQAGREGKGGGALAWGNTSEWGRSLWKEKFGAEDEAQPNASSNRTAQPDSSSSASTNGTTTALPTLAPATSGQGGALAKTSPVDRQLGLADVSTSLAARDGSIVTSSGSQIISVAQGGGAVGQAQQPRGEETKVWTKEFRRMYDEEIDPDVREMMREMGADLPSWVTKEEVERAPTYEGDEEELERQVEEYLAEMRARKKEELRRKKVAQVLDSPAKAGSEWSEEELWWLSKKEAVIVSFQQEVDGKMLSEVYILDLSTAMESEEMVDGEPAQYIVAFESGKEAHLFCKALRAHRTFQMVNPNGRLMKTEDLARQARASGQNVLFLRKGQLKFPPKKFQAYEDLADQLVTIGRNAHLDKFLKRRSVDIMDAIEQQVGREVVEEDRTESEKTRNDNATSDDEADILDALRDASALGSPNRNPNSNPYLN